MLREDIVLLLRLILKCDKCRNDLQKVKTRFRHIMGVKFNLDCLPDEECIKKFWLLPK